MTVFYFYGTNQARLAFASRTASPAISYANLLLFLAACAIFSILILIFPIFDTL